MRIDLDARLSEGWLLSSDEIEDFTGTARLGFKALAEPLECPKPVRAKATTTERVLRKPKRSKPGVDTRVARTRDPVHCRVSRLAREKEVRSASAQYLSPNWLPQRRMSGADISPNADASLLKARAPKVQKRNPDSEREALSEEAERDTPRGDRGGFCQSALEWGSDLLLVQLFTRHR